MNYFNETQMSAKMSSDSDSSDSDNSEERKKIMQALDPNWKLQSSSNEITPQLTKVSRTSVTRREVLPPLEKIEIKVGQKLAARMDEAYISTENVPSKRKSKDLGGIKLFQNSCVVANMSKTEEGTRKRPQITRRLSRLTQDESCFDKRRKCEQVAIDFNWVD